MPESARCLICCAEFTRAQPHPYHTKCLRELFGTTRMPTLEVDPSQLHLLGLEMAGRTTLSGVQRKIALGLEHQALRVSASPSRFILKPAETRFPSLPENEHLCMLLARLVGLDVPPLGLVSLSDGSLALIIRRFDRTESGTKLAMEDFCQLAELLPSDKYSGSAELCVKLVRKFSAAPPLDLRMLFRLFLFSWWVGNGDLHLKNLSLLTQEEHQPRLSPAYDLVNTTLVIPDDQLALPLAGKRANLRTEDWLEFAERCSLPPVVVTDLASRFLRKTGDCLGLIRRSFLPVESQVTFAMQLVERGAAIMDLVELADAASKKRPKTGAARLLSGEGVARIRLELQQRLPKLGRTFKDTYWKKRMADLDWLAGVEGSVFASEGRFQEDPERATSAFIGVMRCDRLMRSLRLLEGAAGLDQVTKHLQELDIASEQDDEKAQQARDHLFQLELGALLKTSFWSTVFERDGLDIALVDSRSDSWGVECKRPRVRKTLLGNIEKGIKQLNRRREMGVVAISLDLLLHDVVTLAVDEHADHSWAHDMEQLIASIKSDVEGLLQESDMPSDETGSRVLGVLFCRNVVMFQKLEEEGYSAAVRSHVQWLSNPAVPEASRMLEFLRDITIAGERALWLSGPS